MAASGSPCDKMGEPDATLLLKLLARHSGPRQLHLPKNPKGSKNTDAPNQGRAHKLRALMNKHKQNMFDKEICFAYNTGRCSQDGPHQHPKDQAKQLQHLCGICNSAHPLVECPSSGLPP